MSWTDLTLATPASSAINVDFDVQVFEVSPWSHAVNEGVGHHTWLSFPNAVKAVIHQLSDFDGSAVFAVAVSANNASALAAQCAALFAGLPLRQLSQWQRHAQQCANIERDKMILADQQVVKNSSVLNAIPTVARLQKKALSQQALTDADAIAAQNPLTNLNTFEADKAAFDADVAIDETVSGGGGYRFYSEGDIASDLVVGHPNDSYTLTSMLVFAGSPSDLAFLTELMP